MKELTKQVKKRAQDYYEKYKDLKKDFLLKRRELKAQADQLNQKNKLNIQENETTKNNLSEYEAELKLFNEKMNFDIQEEKDDVKKIASILDSLVEDVNIFDGLEEEDAIVVSEALNEYLKENKSFSSESEIDNFDVNQQVERIKEVVNNLYQKKKVYSMQIKYVDNKIFAFDKKCVLLTIKDNVIYGKFQENSIFY